MTSYGKTIIPNKSFAYIEKDNAAEVKALKKFNYSDYNDKTKYYKAVEEISNNQRYLNNTYLAVDEEHNQFLLWCNTSSKYYVYDLADFLSGKVTLKKSFSGIAGSQGIEIYGNYVYQYKDNGTHGMRIRKYNIKKGKLEKEVTFSLNDDGFECEGMCMYKGKLFVNKRNGGYDRLYYVDGI